MLTFVLCFIEIASYERKGKLAKKSLNSNAFKERHFVLERDMLYYFKSDKASKFFGYWGLNKD